METNNSNLPGSEMNQPFQQTRKWYQHKGLLAIIILVIIAGAVVWFYTSRQTNTEKATRESNTNTNLPQSNNNTQIRGFGQIKTVAPVEDEKWLPGNKYLVKWQAANLPASSQIKISLIPVVSPAGGTVNTTNFTTSNSGSYELTVPNLKSGAYWVQIDEIKADNTEGLRDRSVQIIITQGQENVSTTNSGLVNCGYIPADKFDPRKFQNPDYRKSIICMSQAWQTCSPAEYSETNSDAVTNNFKIVSKVADGCKIKVKTTQTNESYACTISPALTAELYNGTQQEKDIAFMSVQTSIGLFVAGMPDKYTTCVKEAY